MAEAVDRSMASHEKEGVALPDLVLVDGGPTQVAAARAALDARNFVDLPVAGLAKRYEELYLPGRNPSTHGPFQSGSFQRVTNAISGRTGQ